MIIFYCVITMNVNAQVKILFDATKAETAGNADWVIDADQHNLGWNPDAILFGDDDANAQRIPNPLQSTITSSTPESYWVGGISNWGIDCVKQGYAVETLPYNGAITFNNSGNVQDLSNYKIFVVCEPNILFTATEKIAILNFVQAGGSLFMISDHNQSDRNFDGADSPTIWNDLMSSNPFGITFNLNNYSGTSTSVITTAGDSIAYGPYGHVSEVLWSGGTDMTISTSVNPTVKGVVFKNGNLNNNTKVMFAYARYGAGKVAAMGDSSPADDGSGDPNDVLYNGYITDAAGNHEKLIMNATIWLASENSPNGINVISETNSINIFASEKNIRIKNNSGENTVVIIYDILGNIISNKQINDQDTEIGLNNISDGIYIVKVMSDQISVTKKIIITE